jgi:hypothetical protein
VLLGQTALLMASARLHREWKREEMDIRMSVMPFLTAEEDVQ